MEMRSYARALREKPSEGPAADLLWEVKAEVKRMKDEGLIR